MFSSYKKSGTAHRPRRPSQGPAARREAEPAESPRRRQSLRRPPHKPAAPAPADKERKRKERLAEIKIDLHRALLDNLNLSALDSASEADLRAEISAIASEVLEERGIVLNREDRTTLTQELYDEVKGLGPLETLLKDDSVNDILVNGPHQIFVERAGKLELSDVTFKDEKHLLRIIDKIVSAVGRRVDESNPYVDARLADGSRFNAMVPPIAVDGSLVSIRKFKKDKLGIDDLVGFRRLLRGDGRLSAGRRRLPAQHHRLGRDGLGQDHHAQRAVEFIDNAERILTIEDTAELQLQQIHVGRMESRPPNVEGKGEVTRATASRTRCGCAPTASSSARPAARR